MTIFDARNGAGNPLSTGTGTFTLAVGKANTGSLTLQGIPSTFAITGLPSATAGTALASPASFSVAVKDAAGDVITGTYATPVTLSDNDASGATELVLGASSPSTSVQLVSDAGVPKIAYNGLAVSPVTLTAKATGATTNTATFAPSLTGPSSTCSVANVQAVCFTPGPQISLYATTGDGSSAAFTTSQAGWSGSFGQTFSENDDCATEATIATADHLTFTATVPVNANAGTCTVTLAGGAGQTENIALTYTSSTIGVGARHPHRP